MVIFNPTIKSAFVSLAVSSLLASAAPVEKRQIDIGSGNSIGDGNLDFTGLPSFPTLPKRQLELGSGNSILSDNGDFDLRSVKDKRQLEIGSGNSILDNNGDLNLRRSVKEERQLDIGSGNSIGDGNFDFKKRQFEIGSGNSIGDGNLDFNLKKKRQDLLFGSDNSILDNNLDLKKRQELFGSDNSVLDGNLDLKKRQELFGSDNSVLDGNLDLKKRQELFGSGNSILDGNFDLLSKRQIEILSGNSGGDGNLDLCRRLIPSGEYGSGNSILNDNGDALATVRQSDTPISWNQDVAASRFPDPTIDQFYAAQQDDEEIKLLEKAQPGQVLRSRLVHTIFTHNVDYTSQVYYRTTSSTKKVQGTVATVMKPIKPKSPAQILSYHTYEDSASLNCNPSWALIPGTASHGRIPVSLDSHVYIQHALDNGIYVVIPDHLGPQAAWLAGLQAGAAVLDGIRAIISHFDLLSDAQVVLLGYSGGGHATSWAVNMQRDYAPKVNIIGAISGGTIIDTLGAFQYIDGTIISGFAGAGLIGMMAAYPELEEYVMTNFDQQGREKLLMYRQANMCIPEVSITNVNTNFTAHFTNPDPLNHPIVVKIMRQETLLSSASSITTFTPSYPRLIWHAGLDTIVPLDTVKQYVSEECARNANIQFQVLPLTEHIAALVLGVPGIVEFMTNLFNHTTSPIECGTSRSDFPTLLSPLRARKILGNKHFKFLYSLYGQSLVGRTLKIVAEQILDSDVIKERNPFVAQR